MRPAISSGRFGVLHHTGDTYRAFKHVARWSSPAAAST